MENDNFQTQQEHGRKKKTTFQLQSLEQLYAEDKYPKQKIMEEYGASLGLMYNQVRIWFTERRRREKRENLALALSRKRNRTDHNIHVVDCNPRKGSHNNGKQRSLSDRSAVVMSNKSVGNEFETSESDQLKGNSCVPYTDDQHTQERGNVATPGCRTVKMSGKKSRSKSLLKRKSFVQLQVLFSQDYILKRVFRKDGPPLGTEFDPLPAKAFGYHPDNNKCPQSCHGIKKLSNKRKVLDSYISNNFCGKNFRTGGYGVGKGLMTVWRATNPNGGSFPMSKQNSVCNGRHGKANRRLPIKRKKVHDVPLAIYLTRFKEINVYTFPQKGTRLKGPCTKGSKTKKLLSTECSLISDEPKSQEQSDASLRLMDDEELELSELQAGPNPFRCSAHLTSNGRNGCPLCKDMLDRFPPQSVKMRQPLCGRPWVSSPEIVKKLFKVFRFLYTYAGRIHMCSFTLDELAQAFHDKDSLLLAKIHVSLLKVLLSDVKRDITSGFLPRSSKDCRFLGFLHSVKQQNFDVTFWLQSLNSLTWIEIFRQVSIAAGFGSKGISARRETSNKEGNHMGKYGLHPHTLKCQLFCILTERGSRGSKVSELARASQIVSLGLPNRTDELETLICSTLSSDITLFEKIGPSSFRLRVNPKKDENGSDSESDDCGSIDENSLDFSSCSSFDEHEKYDGLASALCVQRTRQCKGHLNKNCKRIVEYTEIDESFSGEAWLLGLMEGEYSDLSIEEKLDALIALVELTGSTSGLKMEEAEEALSVGVPDMRYHGSGGKIKKSISNRNALLDDFLFGLCTSQEGFGSELTYEGSMEKSRLGNLELTSKSKSHKHPLQAINLGSDRRYNSYWLFLGPCDKREPGHRRVYFESSEDGHWEVIDTKEALSCLLSALDCRGTREARLLASLEKREESLCQAMTDYIEAEFEIRQSRISNISDAGAFSGSGSSPVSDVDNNASFGQSANSYMTPIVIGNKHEEIKLNWDELQAFDKWIWNCFCNSLNAVKNSRRSYHESLARCESCHDLFWRDEKHCKVCHMTFELDFNLEERYAIHLATCRETNERIWQSSKVLPSQLQALKAGIHAIEAAIPEDALISTWKKSSHILWGKRLRRTSSLPELLQVMADFVAAIKDEWSYECASNLCLNAVVDDVLILFQTMPQTVSAIALWMVKLDALIASYLRRPKEGQESLSN